MLLISSTIKNVFKRVFILMILVEILLLGVIIIIYRTSTEKVSSSLHEYKKNSTIFYRDLFAEYLKRKYTLIIDDLVLFMQAYDTLQENRKLNHELIGEFTEEKISKCVIHGGDASITKNEDTKDWYFNGNDLNFIERRLKATWWYGKQRKTIKSLEENDKANLIDICILQDVLRNILLKHLRWYNSLSSTFEYFTISFYNSLFLKYPIYYNSYMKDANWKNTIPANCKTPYVDGSYDPKCRPFYLEILNNPSNIVSLKPYLYPSTGLVGTEICIKSKNQKFFLDKDYPELILCMKLNFKDFQKYRAEISTSLGIKKSIYLVFPDGDNLTKISVMMNSDFPSDQLTTYGNNLTGTNFYDINSLFEVYSKKMFDSYYSETKAKNQTINPYLNETYLEAYNFYEKNIHNKLLASILKYKIMEENKTIIDQSNFNNYADHYYFRVNGSYKYFKFNNSIEYSDSTIQDIYFFPIYVSFNYTGNYIIQMHNKTQFYFLLIANREKEYENVSTFLNVILLEIILYFFFLTGVNIFTWAMFGIIYYYFSKGFLLPLSEINFLYKNLFLLGENINANKSSIENDDELSSNQLNYFENKITSWIYQIFELDNHPEIQDCIRTLKMLKIFRSFDPSVYNINNLVLNYELSKDAVLLNMADALFFLMRSMSHSYEEEIKFDHSLIVNLIFNNFVYLINSYEDEAEVEAFFNEMNKIIERILNKKITRRSSQRLSKLFRKETRKDSELFNSENKDVNFFMNFSGETELYNENPTKNIKYSSLLKEFRDAFIKLKENLQYRYCIFRMRILESKFYGKDNLKDYIDYNYNSDEDDREINKNENKNYLQMDVYTEEDNLIEENLLKKEKEKRRNIEELSYLVTEFNRYFSLTDESHVSFDSLKHIAAHITQSGLLFEIDSEEKGIKQCIMAMEKIKNLHSKIETHGILAKFAYLSVITLLFERILFLLSSLSEKFDQKKTQFYTYLNILDLGPVYDRKIRANILQKLLDHFNKKSIDFVQNAKSQSHTNFFKDDGFVNSKLVRHKVRAMLNVSKIFPKNILLLCDLNIIFLKEHNFQNILINSVLKSKHFFYFAAFDQKLYIHRNIELQEQDYTSNTLEQIVDQNYFLNLSYNDQEVVNLFRKKEKITHEFEESQEKSEKTEEADFNNYVSFLSFINSHKKINNVFTQNLNSRVDISIKNVIKYHKFKEYPKNNNYLIVITSIDAGFSFERDNRIQISEAIYEGQYSLIMCILYDKKLINNEKYRKKLLCYKKFIESEIVNGHIFLLKSFTLLKYVINCVIPNKFKEFDISTMKTLMESVNLNFCEAIENEISDENKDLNKPINISLSKVYSNQDE